MQQIKQLLNDLYGKKAVARYNLFCTIQRLGLAPITKGRKPKRPGPRK